MNRVWLFRCVTQHCSQAVTQRWEWRAESPDGTVSTSKVGFHTLAACVHDAQRAGFLGVVDPASGIFSTNHYEMKVGDYGDVVFKPRPPYSE